MASKGKFSRRSFLSQVAGTALTTGALATVTGPAGATQAYTGLTDRDSGSSADRSGYGRRQRTGETDADTGSNRDEAGYGTGGSQTGVTDRDPASTDRAGYGRNINTGLTDRDTGATADPAGQGRRPETGCTDHDGGSNMDRAGHGINCR